MGDTTPEIKTFEIIVAADEKLGIGYAGSIPWKLPGDIKRFRDLSQGTREAFKVNCVIMGRKTYLSIPEKFRPLSKRYNIVLTSDPEFNTGVSVAKSFEMALEAARNDGFVETIFVIGGGEVYKAALASEYCSKIHYTLVMKEFECDTFFPKIDDTVFRLEKPVGECEVHTENGVNYCYLTFVRM